MPFEGILKGLALDTWYKLLIAVGFAGCIVSFTVDIKTITNLQLLLISSSMFFMGLGVWKSERSESSILPPNAYTGGVAYIRTRKVSQLDIVGLFFFVLSFVLFIYFLIDIL